MYIMGVKLGGKIPPVWVAHAQDKIRKRYLSNNRERMHWVG